MGLPADDDAGPVTEGTPAGSADMTNDDNLGSSDAPKARSLQPSAGSEAFFAQVYDELRLIAHARMRGERTDQTLQSTELVHEAYLRLRAAKGLELRSRGEFFSLAAEAMRRILTDRARAKGRAKRGGDSEGKLPMKLALDLEEVAALADDRDPETVLALDRAIERLAQHDPRVAQTVKLRFYAGLSVEEVAETLEVTPRTVLRDWAFARLWLFRELASENPSK
jgi:RNA polymerase sigma factor (TIGR02999 family)